jgi:hypothetical protein
VPVLKSETPLETYGFDILDNGFPIIPIKHMSKMPSIPAWQDFKTHKKHVHKWASNGRGDNGIGLLTERFPTCDLDILDPDIACDMMQYVTDNYGSTIQKTGQQPKLSLVYRTDEPFSKVTSPAYISPDGLKHQVEILGKGQQTVMIGYHPGTEAHYRFNTRATLVNTKAESLPPLTEADAHDIVRAFTEMVPSDWVVQGSGSASTDLNDDDEDFHKTLIPPVDLTYEETVYYLSQLPASEGDYTFWYKVGAALWHQMSGSDEAFDLWHDWSQADVEGYLGTNEK